MSIFTDYDDLEQEHKTNTDSNITKQLNDSLHNLIQKSNLTQQYTNTVLGNTAQHSNTTQLHSNQLQTPNINYTIHNNNIQTPLPTAQQHTLPLHLQIQFEHDLTVYEQSLLTKQNNAIQQANTIKQQLLQQALKDAGNNPELIELANERFATANNDMLHEFNKHRQQQIQQYTQELIHKYMSIAATEQNNTQRTIQSSNVSGASTPSRSTYVAPVHTHNIVHSPQRPNYANPRSPQTITQSHYTVNNSTVDIRTLEQVYKQIESVAIDMEQKAQTLRNNLKLLQSVIDTHNNSNNTQNSKSVSRPVSAIKPRIDTVNKQSIQPTKAILRPTTSYANRQSAQNNAQPAGFGSSSRKSTRPSTSNLLRTPSTKQLRTSTNNTTSTKSIRTSSTKPIKHTTVSNKRKQSVHTTPKQFDAATAANILATYQALVRNADQKIDKQLNQLDHIDAEQYYAENHYNAIDKVLNPDHSSNKNDPTNQLKQILATLQIK